MGVSACLFNNKSKKYRLEMVFCLQNCSDLVWENCSDRGEKQLKFKAEENFDMATTTDYGHPMKA